MRTSVLFFAAELVTLLCCAVLAMPGDALSDDVFKDYQKVSNSEGGFMGTLDYHDWFGCSIVSLGDLDGDAVADIAVGAKGDDQGGIGRGAVWILFLQSDGTVKDHQKISSSEGGFTGSLDDGGHFGCSVASLGDLDGDAVADIAVGALEADDRGEDRGAVWILFLQSDGTVKAHQKISSSEGSFTGTLDNEDRFGCSVASLGDLDGDDVADMAVGATEDDDGSYDCGAVWILFLRSDGTVKAHQKISNSEGGFTGILDSGDHFGCSVASLGDLDGDDVADMAVGAIDDDDGGTGRGAVWILFLRSDGTVKAHQKISSCEGGFTGILDDGDHFGCSVAPLGDLDGDAVADMAVGATEDDDGGTARGAVWIIFLQSDGAVKAYQKLSSCEGGFTGILDDGDHFGCSVASLGDLNGDAVVDMAVGATEDDDGAYDCGAAWLLFLETPVCSVNPREQPSTLGFHANFPNPFNQLTRIRFSLDREDALTLAIFDAAGKHVRTLISRRLVPGEYFTEWDGRNGRGQKIPSGVYFCRLEAGNDALVMKIVVVK